MKILELVAAVVCVVCCGIDVNAQVVFKECPQSASEDEEHSCVTCSYAYGNPPPGASIDLNATKCPDPPGNDCDDCCWDVTFSFDAGGGAIDYEYTFLQFSGGDKHKVAAGGEIKRVKLMECNTEDYTESCVKAELWFDLVFFPSRRCMTLACDLCPASLPE